MYGGGGEDRVASLWGQTRLPPTLYYEQSESATYTAHDITDSRVPRLLPLCTSAILFRPGGGVVLDGASTEQQTLVGWPHRKPTGKFSTANSLQEQHLSPLPYGKSTISGLLSPLASETNLKFWW